MYSKNKALQNQLSYFIKNKKKCEIALDKYDQFAGYIGVNKNGFIGPLYIENQYGGYGLSNILLKDAIEKYNGNKLGVIADNFVAINLYKKFGFKTIDSKLYKDGTVVYIMSL